MTSGPNMEVSGRLAALLFAIQAGKMRARQTAVVGCRMVRRRRHVLGLADGVLGSAARRCQVVHSGRMQREWRALAAQVVRSAMSAKGDRAVTATDDHRVQFWELPSGRLLHDQPVS